MLLILRKELNEYFKNLDRKIKTNTLETSVEQDKLYHIITGGYGLEILKCKKIKRLDENYWKKKKENRVIPEIDLSIMEDKYYTTIFQEIYEMNPMQLEFLRKTLFNRRDAGFRQREYYLKMLAQELAQYTWYSSNMTSIHEMEGCFGFAHGFVLHLYYKILSQIPVVEHQEHSNPLTTHYLRQLRDMRALNSLKDNLISHLKVKEYDFVNGIEMGAYTYRKLKKQKKQGVVINVKNKYNL